MEEYNNILSRYDAVAKQAVNFDIDAQRYFTVFDLKCQIALALGADLQDVKDCLSVYDVDYLIYKTYGGTLSKLDLMSDYDVLVATIAILDSGIDTSLIDSEFIAEMTLVNLLVPVQSGYFYLEPLNDNTEFAINSVDGAPTLNLEYSSDGKTWQNWDYTTNHITANAGERVYLRGQNEEWTTIVGTDEVEPIDKIHYNSIISASDAQFNIGGRLSSLFTGNEEETDKSIIMSAIFYNSACKDASKVIVPKNAKLSYAFMGCSSLISAPRTLSDSILHVNQYKSTFDGCTSLTKAPKLPATTLMTRCYYRLFYGCTSLLDAPQLPATSLAAFCYHSLFFGCTSLKAAPELPATSLKQYSYGSMFRECSSLTKAPEMHAMTLASECCDNMFSSCTSLVEAPELPATTLVPYCYRNMFYNCLSLRKAPQLPAKSLATECYSWMFANCTSLEEAPQLPATKMAPRCYEQMFANCKSLKEAPQLPATTLAERCYLAIFSGCTSLTNAPELPAKTLKPYCYRSMFYRCTSLTNAPELPVTTLVEDCYNSMFSECTSLVNAPELPATALAANCYSGMFYMCKSLITPPELPATTLAANCYFGMFNGCSSLTTFNFGNQSIFANLTNSLQQMFNNCSKLSYIRCLFDDRDGNGPREYTNWVSGVAAQGTFVTNTDKWKRGANGIPSGWEVVIEGASA